MADSTTQVDARPSRILPPPVTVMVPLRDGVRLAADVYSAGDGPHPVILERTPYGRMEIRGSDQDRFGASVPTPAETSGFFAAAGYTVVRQDCRGRGDSEGSFVKYLNEGPDGADTIEWIAAQDWCNGQVMMMGVSYSAHAQTAAAAHSPRGLSGMFMDSGGLSNAYDAGMRMGGAFELKQVTWAFQHGKSSEAAHDDVVRAALEATNLADWFGAFPWKPGLSPLAQVPEYEDYLLEQWGQGTFDEYWTQSALYARGHYEAFPDVPSMHVGSWYDPYVRSTIENFSRLGELKKSPSYLVMGPWTHGSRTQTYAGDVDFGSSAAFDLGLGRSYLEFRRDWFDTHRQNVNAAAGTGNHPEPGADPKAEAAFPRVSYFLMGGGTGTRTADGRLDHGGRWMTAPAWPPADTTPLSLFLGVSGTLQPTADTEARSISYDFDPAHPVPTMGGQVTSGEPVMVGGGFDQTPDERFFGAASPFLPLSSRNDVVTLRTAVLDRDLAVTGPVMAQLWISSSAVDTDFTIKLVDEYPPSADYPNGFALNLTDGIFRCRFHRSFEKAEPLVPGEVYLVEVVAPDTANVFAAGHRLRLDVSSSNFPRFDVNRNTGENEAYSRTSVIARNTVHSGAATPSNLQLRVLDIPKIN